MKVTNNEPVLECSLDEFWNEFWSKQQLGIGETKEDAEETFRGESKIKPKFRIPSADRKSDIFFDNREVLCRFANFPTPTQERILRSIRQALTEKNVKQMIITIPWSKNGQKKLRIRSSGFDFGALDFETLL